MTASVTPLRRGHTRAAYRAGLADRLGPVSAFLPGYELHLLSKGQAAKTVEKKLLAARQLQTFLGDPDVGAVTRSDIEAFMVARLGQVSRASAATTYVALKSFFAYLAVDLGTFESPMVGTTAPAYEEKPVAVVPDDVLQAMIKGAERGKASEWEDVRDAALLRCFVDTGSRLSEITNLTLSDLIPLDDGRTLLRVWGKGRGGGPRERHVPLGEKAGIALRRYLRVRGGHPFADSPRLWLARKGPLTPGGVRQMIKKRSTRAGMQIHPHQLRHTWAAGMKSDERNRDADIMHQAGWVDPRMLAKYGRAVTAKRSIDRFYAHGAPGDKL
jgi:integrase/recombinase XerC